MLEACDQAYNGTRPIVEPIEYETHYDPDLVSLTLHGLTLTTPRTPGAHLYSCTSHKHDTHY